MARRSNQPEQLSTEAALSNLTVDNLKPLAALVTDSVPKRKGELVAVLTKFMSNQKAVQSLYEKLDPLAQKAVQEATYDQQGELNHQRFLARHGTMPDFYEPVPEEKRQWYSYRQGKPKPLHLFFPSSDLLPADLQQLLLTFVQRPPDFTLPTQAELPATVTQTWTTWKKNGAVEESEDIPLRLRETALPAEQNLRSVLRLIEAGRLRVSDKKRQPTAASLKAIAAVLAGGDFYTAEDQEEWKYDPAGNLTIEAFAWPMLVQAGGLAEKSGDNLKLTSSGRKALVGKAADVLRNLFRKWRTSTLLDEFSRIEAIKGQGKGSLSAVATRRKTVLDALAHCPTGQWFAVDDFFRFLQATDRDFVVSREPWDLYIAEHYYGSLGYESQHTWEQLQGRYILAILFEYVATLGLIDVAYLPPQNARHDFQDRWGTDDMSCLSRYDGLCYVRINPLGAWCLGMAAKYEVPKLQVEDILQVLPNLDVAVKKPPLSAADRLVLDRYAEPQSEGVWQLQSSKILAALEAGGTLEELTEFIAARSSGALPSTVQTLLDDLRQRASKLRDLGLVRIVECADAALARELAVDPKLRGRCQLAGERCLVFGIEDEKAVRQALRRLGYIVPPQQGT